MTDAARSQISRDDIPVVDIQPLRDGSDPVRVARALHAANTQLGFIYIKGHGIPESLIEETRSAALQFFRLPADRKETVRVEGTHRGWMAVGGAKMYDDAKADQKESFIWGYQDASGQLPDDHEIRGLNKWPAMQPKLETVCMAYFAAAHRVAEHLLRGFALGLGLAADVFLKTRDRPLSRGSLVYYPPQDDTDADVFGVAPHTDFGVLTVLCQDSVGGLQVQGLDGSWIDAPPIEGTLLVNVGDLLRRWTDGAYNSTPHRVINRSGRERLSLVLAYDPNPETMIDAREIVGSEREPKELPISCGDYLIWRFAKAFAYRQGDHPANSAPGASRATK